MRQTTKSKLGLAGLVLTTTLATGCANVGTGAKVANVARYGLVGGIAENIVESDRRSYHGRMGDANQGKPSIEELKQQERTKREMQNWMGGARIIICGYADTSKMDWRGMARDAMAGVKDNYTTEEPICIVYKSSTGDVNKDDPVYERDIALEILDGKNNELLIRKILDSNISNSRIFWGKSYIGSYEFPDKLKTPGTKKVRIRNQRKILTQREFTIIESKKEKQEKRDYMDELKKLKELQNLGVITEEQYNQKSQPLLKELGF